MEGKSGWLWLASSAANCFIAVAMGAMGSHMFAMTAQGAATFATAADYQMWHGLAIGVIALWKQVGDSRALNFSLWMFLVGIILFCGPLYVIAVTGMRELGALAPIGGTLLLGAWLLVAIGAITKAR